MFFFFFLDESRLKPGTVCRVLGRDEGKTVVVHKVYSLPDGLSLWCYENRPVRYRINRSGDKVVDFDPACILSPYRIEDLVITDEVPVQDGGWGASYRRGRRL